MANFQTLRIYHRSQQQLRDIAAISRTARFGDLANQLRRAAISVVSNIVEGAGRGSDAEFARFLRVARASNDEAAAQIQILASLTGNDLRALLILNDQLGRMISTLIRALHPDS